MNNCDSALSAYKIHVLNFDPRAVMKKIHVVLWITKGYYYEIRREKNTWERQIVRSGGKRVISDCKITIEGVNDTKEEQNTGVLSPKILERGKERDQKQNYQENVQWPRR